MLACLLPCVLAWVHVSCGVCCGAHFSFTHGSRLYIERDNTKIVRACVSVYAMRLMPLLGFCSVAAVTPWMRAGETPGRRRSKSTSTNCRAARGSRGRSSGTASSGRPWQTCTVLWLARTPRFFVGIAIVCVCFSVVRLCVFIGVGCSSLEEKQLKILIGRSQDCILSLFLGL